MNRRTFLQTAGIALGALALPTVAHTSLSAPSQPTKPLWVSLQECYQSQPSMIGIDETMLEISEGAFRVGDVLLIDSEFMFITGFTDQVCSVVRGFASSQAAAHFSDSHLKLIASARKL